ncbi:MAG: iron donor protein CyaY [Pseudomonadales bacterium]|jgi:CyaY protein|nr:iron donor protein CyaY [Pseudomonadales bacterium]
MSDAEFLELYQATLAEIESVVEDAINEHDAAIDYESANDMLTLTFITGSVVVISRQTPLRQLWLAARSGGFHFDWEADLEQWHCKLNGQILEDMLSEICLEQGGVRIHF